jgi:lipid-binding SYLF domain-containing protein
MSVKTTGCVLAFASLLGAAMLARPAQAASKEAETLDAACEVIDALAGIPLKGIPPALLKDAQGVAIIPGVIKAGFVIGGRHGRGVLLVRDDAGCWGNPVFLTLSGGSIGWQAGVQSTDLVLLFRTRSSVERILKGKGKVTLGADVGVAAGPIGRQAEAGTDAQLMAEIYSYSRSRGLFVGLSLEGAALVSDPAATDAYYRAPRATVLDSRTGKMIPLTPPEDKLRLKLTTLTATPAPLPLPSAPPPLAPPVPMSPPLTPLVPVPVPPPPPPPVPPPAQPQ